MFDERRSFWGLLGRRRKSDSTPRWAHPSFEHPEVEHSDEADRAIAQETRRLLEPLRRPVIAPAGDDEVEAARPEELLRLGQLIKIAPLVQAKAERQQRLLWVSLAGGLTLAAAALAWLMVSSAQLAVPPAARLTLVAGQLSQKGTALSAGADYAIETLGRLSTPNRSGARLVTDEGVSLALAPSSVADLSFAGHQRRVALNSGRVELSVPKLAEGTSLSVTTPDAVVTVHGTRFSVALNHGQTCVKVSEGIVSVARGDAEERLVAGQQSGCATQAANAARTTSALPEQALGAGPTSAGQYTSAGQPQAAIPRQMRGRTEASKTAGASGTLTQVNRLFKRTLAAEQAGRWREAETLATQLLSRYPASPMAPEMRRVLARVKARQVNAPTAGR